MRHVDCVVQLHCSLSLSLFCTIVFLSFFFSHSSSNTNINIHTHLWTQFVSWDGTVNYSATQVLRPTSAPTLTPSASLHPSTSPTSLPSATPTLLPSSVPTQTPSSHPTSLPSITPLPSVSFEPTIIQTPTPSATRDQLCVIDQIEGNAQYTSCGATNLNVSNSKQSHYIGFDGYDSIYRLDVISTRTVRVAVCASDDNNSSSSSTFAPYLWLYNGCPFSETFSLLSTSDETSKNEV
jgi:hypothetical protein